MSLVIDLLTIAKKSNNYDIDATAGGLWISDVEYRVTVPVNKRYYLFGGAVFRDVSGTVTVAVRDVAGKLILMLGSEGATTGTTNYPVAAYNVGLVPIDAGEYIQAYFGASQSTTAYCTAIVLEVNV